MGGQSESGIPDVNFNLLNLSKLISDGRQNFFGLINEAYFCYLNSALQMLYSITDFVNFVVKEDFGELQKPSNINDENFNNDKTKLATLKILFSDLKKANNNTEQIIKDYQDYFAYVINKIPIGRTRTTQDDPGTFILNLIGILDDYKNNENIKKFLELFQITLIKSKYDANKKYLGSDDPLTESTIEIYGTLGDESEILLQNRIDSIKTILNELVDHPTYKYDSRNYIIPETNKYLIINNTLKIKILQNEDKTITIENKKYRLLCFIAQRGEITAQGSMCGHYVFYYTKPNNMKIINDSNVNDITDNDLQNNQIYKKDYEHAYLLLYERIDNITPSGGGLESNNKITKKKKTKYNKNKITKKKKTKYNKNKITKKYN